MDKQTALLMYGFHIDVNKIKVDKKLGLQLQQCKINTDLTKGTERILTYVCSNMKNIKKNLSGRHY